MGKRILMSGIILGCLVCSSIISFAEISVYDSTGSFIGTFTTIQAGIDACPTGGKVIVADGTYTGTGNKDLSWSGKKITVGSLNGANNCIIDCQNSGRGFYLNGEGDCGTISGFTIRNGNVTGYVPDDSGGGIYCKDSSPTITNCTISGNNADFSGGIFCHNSSSPTITNCTISGNTGYYHGGGIGINCYNSSSPTITNCTISGNTTGGRGGGIFCHNSSSPTITNCTISGNFGYYYGGGIDCSSSSPTITNCTISGNDAYHGGGGIDCSYGSSPIICNNIISNNSNYGIYEYDTYSDTQTNYNCFYNNSPHNYRDEGKTGGVDVNDVNTIAGNRNNISDNPQFISSTDYHLQAISPCINAGSNTAPAMPPTDKDGNPRPYNGGIADMGAYEFQGTPTLTITTTSLPFGQINTYYQSTLIATGGIPPYIWADSGNLPTGLSLNSSTGIISGVPVATSTFIFIAEVKDNDTPQQTATKSLTIVIGFREYWITLDEHDKRLPTDLIKPCYYNWTGGDRGILHAEDVEYTWDGDSIYTARVINCSGPWTYGGMWYSLNRIKRDNIPLDFKAIFGHYVKPEYQGEIVEIEIVVSKATSTSNNTGLKLSVELKDKDENKIFSNSWTDLIPGSYPQTYTVSLEPSQLTNSNIELVTWILDNAQIGDSISVDRIRLKARVPDLSTEEQAFLWTYSWLMANYDANTGIVQDRSNFGTGDFENISATAKAAKITYYAYKKGYITYEDAKAVITKIADTLINVVPRGPTGINTLWPHFTGTGGTTIIPDTEWASGDTAYAALDIITALAMLGDPQGQMSYLIKFVEDIGWQSMLLADGGISHGYDYNGGLLPHSWKGFGMETIGVDWAYASAKGKVAKMEGTPTDNGSGFIENAHYPMVISGLDGWGNDWDIYRTTMADKQIGWYSTPEHYNKYVCDANLFGLSAAETPEEDSYIAYGIGGKYEPPNDGNEEVVVLHYPGIIADIRPTEAKKMWESLLSKMIISPLNCMESIRVSKTTGTYTINHLKASWNLALQSEGWAMTDSNIRNDLQAAIQNNTFLKKGYDLIKTPREVNMIITKKARNISQRGIGSEYFDPEEIVEGNIIEFKILVQNTGIGTATDVVVTDKVPDGLTYTGVITGKEADDSQKPNLKWTVGTMTSNSSEALTFQSKVIQQYTRECEYPDEYTVGTMIWRSNASASKVHGQFGCEGYGPWPGKAGYVKYKNINLHKSEHLYLILRYSKYSSSYVPIRVYLDEETTPRVSFYPVNQGNWNIFTETAAIDLGSITTGIHTIKFETDGQQYGVADLDKFTIF